MIQPLSTSPPTSLPSQSQCYQPPAGQGMPGAVTPTIACFLILTLTTLLSHLSSWRAPTIPPRWAQVTSMKSSLRVGPFLHSSLSKPQQSVRSSLSLSHWALSTSLHITTHPVFYTPAEPPEQGLHLVHLCTPGSSQHPLGTQYGFNEWTVNTWL